MHKENDLFKHYAVYGLHLTNEKIDEESIFLKHSSDDIFPKEILQSIREKFNNPGKLSSEERNKLQNELKSLLLNKKIEEPTLATKEWESLWLECQKKSLKHWQMSSFLKKYSAELEENNRLILENATQILFSEKQAVEREVDNFCELKLDIYLNCLKAGKIPLGIDSLKIGAESCH